MTKNRWKIYVTSAVLFAGTVLGVKSVAVHAETTEVRQSEDGRYLYQEDGTFMGYRGSIEADPNADTLVIPAEIDGTAITKIGEQALYGQAIVRYLTIPDTITEIGDEAFLEMPLLEKVEIKANGSAFHESAFKNCDELSQVTFAENTEWKQIPAEMFYGCSALSQITIPDGVVKIGNYAFYQSGITDIALSDDLKTIEDYAFANTKLQSVTLPASIRKIDDGAFSGSSLSTFTWPKKAATMPDNVFLDCMELKELIVPTGVSAVGEWALDTGTDTKVYNSSELEFVGTKDTNAVDAQYLNIRTELQVYAPLSIDSGISSGIVVTGTAVAKDGITYYSGQITVSPVLNYNITELALNGVSLGGDRSFTMPMTPSALTGTVTLVSTGTETAGGAAGGTEAGGTSDGTLSGGTEGSGTGTLDGSQTGGTGSEASTDTTVKKGTKVKDKSSKAYYRVTSVGKKRTVTYLYPAKKTYKTLTIPQKITIKGKSYTVTAIEKNAFKNNKKLKTLTIKSKKITKAGKNIFKNTSKNLTVKVPKSKYKAYKKLFKGKGLKKMTQIKKA